MPSFGMPAGASDLMSVVRGLHFQEDRAELIRQIPPERWPDLLRLTDVAQLTLPLALRRRDCLPHEVQLRVDRNLARNAERTARTGQAYATISRELEQRGIEFIVLKGMTHCPFYCDDLAHRPQFDLDLYCPEASIQPAAQVIAELGYEPIRPARGPAPDHLPSMIRKTGFVWQGDYYDPELPLIVELHFRFWNPGREAFPVAGADGFWNRRTKRIIAGRTVSTLAPGDDLAYTAWHLVRHLVRGNLRLYHVYELAHFLHLTAGAESFWKQWQTTSAGLRTTEPIAFRLAREWFGCKAHPVVLEEIARLPRPVDRWFRMFAFSPVLTMAKPNKDELFLHLALVHGAGDRLRIAAHKLIPMNPPHVVLDAHVKRNDLAFRARRLAFRTRFLLRRVLHHFRLWGPLVQSGFRWWRASWRAA
jgi:hypothetical protein